MTYIYKQRKFLIPLLAKNNFNTSWKSKIIYQKIHNCSRKKNIKRVTGRSLEFFTKKINGKKNAETHTNLRGSVNVTSIYGQREFLIYSLAKNNLSTWWKQKRIIYQKIHNCYRKKKNIRGSQAYRSSPCSPHIPLIFFFFRIMHSNFS